MDIQQKGAHYLNIANLTWDRTGEVPPVSFYNDYRELVMSGLGQKDEVYRGQPLQADENLGPAFEDFILVQVLKIFHPKLPDYVKNQYNHKIGSKGRIMDFKAEILSKTKQFIEEMEQNEIIAAAANIKVHTDEDDPQCNYMRPNFRGNNRGRYNNRGNYNYNRGNFRGNSRSPSTPFTPSAKLCLICKLKGLPKVVFTSHFIEECQNMSSRDKELLQVRMKPQLNNIDCEEDDGEEILDEYGYDEDGNLQQQVRNKIDNYFKISKTKHDKINCSKVTEISTPPTCNVIQPVPTQILTLQDDKNRPIHLDLDSGATVSYAKYDSVLYRNFIMNPNSQISFLADGKSKMPAVGEIDVTLHRNGWSVRLHAIVTKNLHTDFVAGTNFLKENKVCQNFHAGTILIHDKFSIPQTNKSLILPTMPSNKLIKNNSMRILLPGQSASYRVPHQNGQLLSVEPWFQNKNSDWPTPQVCQVQNGHINIQNTGSEPLDLKRDAPTVQIRTTTEYNTDISDTLTNNSGEKQDFSNFKTNVDNTNLINMNTNGIDTKALTIIKNAHKDFKDVFDENLKLGYNNYFGRHECKLNWANNTRPPATKVHTANYNHDTKHLLQQVVDQLTDANVLGKPHEDGIHIQHVSPSFLVRKQRAKAKSQKDLTPNDVRLVVNFGTLNSHLKNMPSPITKPRDVFYQIGKWNFIITTDLYQGFFQNRMSPKDVEWLGIATPFGGLRYLKRSGQGLISMSEELDELLSKVLKDEMQQGIVCRIADDLYIGGKTQIETANNYHKVLTKLSLANLKLSASKTKIFLNSVDILGWVWRTGGYLEPSPHRINALKNAKSTDIKTIKDARSWLGLYKTLLPASKDLTLILSPFDTSVADKESKEPFIWDNELLIAFDKAKENIDKIQCLYLPKPEDQLMIVVDAAKVQPGIGHILYAIKDGKKVPVSFHSTKLSPTHAKWLSCELEALAFATAIQSEYSIIKETKQPVIIAPDSKPVADAVKMIKNGNFSTNPRMQSLITNVNRIPTQYKLPVEKII